jgi:hypothetical protein
MKIIPHRRFTIDTRLTPLEVQARLRDAVEAPTFRLTKPERPFTGRVDGASFDVMRSIQGRNSFRPRVRGTIEAAGRGAPLIGLPTAMVVTFIREARRAFDEIGRIVDASHGELG